MPSPVDAFVGRSAEIASLIDLFQSPAIRLVTVTGRLALEVARHIPERIARSAVFVPLAPVSDPGGVVTAIVQAIGVQRGEEATQRERLIAAMQGRRLLLVLDNFEHVLPAAPLLVDLLEGCADLSILVTSCAPLSISGEHRLPLSPMPVPDLAGRHPKKTASDVMNVDSVRLFVDRANAAGSSFELTECNADAVADICRHLEGLPLALELAAARTSVFDPRSLVKLLNPRLPRLTTGGRNQPPSLQTMRSAIKWSYDLLTADHQALFRRLGAFEGGFTPIIATAVASNGISERELLDDIAFLVDQSLVQPIAQPGGTPWFSMLETIREFAVEQLAKSSDDAPTRQRHAAAYVSLTEGYRPLLEGPKGNHALEQLEREHSNLRVALSWFIEQGDADGALRLGGALWKFWLIHGHLRQGSEWLEQALAMPGGRTSAHRAEALYGAGVLAREVGQRKLAERIGQELLVLSDERHDVLHQAMAFFLVGTLAAHGRDLPLARERYERALGLFREIRHEHGVAMVQHQLGNVARELGDYDAAGARDAEALAIWRQREDQWGSALALNGLAETAERESRIDHAVRLFTAALEINVQLGAMLSGVSGLEGIARLAAQSQQPQLAVQLFSAADAIRKRIGSDQDVLERARNDPALQVARKELGEDAFEAGWTKGQLATLEQAIAIAETEYKPHPNMQPAASRHQSLSHRELEVLRLVATGQTDREIGEVLFISRRTVTSHFTSILNKLGVSSRTAAAAAAVRSGLA
ncbi:hypothetical protein BH23CHL4_BH23CHL4_18460 [soil metagenome]